MINKWVNISAFEGSPPSGGADRKYPQGPVYEIEDVERLAAQGSLQFWTRGAARDAQKWKLDTKDCAKLMQLALHSGRFTGSEWCQQQPQGPWAMCDAYSVSRPEWIEHAGKHLNVSYYLKFAISKTGQLLLMASNHPEGA